MTTATWDGFSILFCMFTYAMAQKLESIFIVSRLIVLHFSMGAGRPWHKVGTFIIQDTSHESTQPC